MRIHLEWMFENQPEYCLELSRNGHLRQHLENKNQQALAMVDRLKLRGIDEDEAFEVATAEVLAPADGPAMMDDPAPTPLPSRDRQRIYESL